MNEIRVNGYVTGKTLTAKISNAAGQFWHVAGEAFETYGADGHLAASYNISLTEKGAGAYRGTFPAAITDAGEYTADIWDSAITTQPVFSQDIIVSDEAVTSLADLIGAIDSGSGDGDYEVTLTIRTTGGSALAGIRAWLSTDNDRENMATGALVTDDSGEVVFNCDYATKYYLHCHLSGYRFATASFTPAAGSVSFTKDIATAVSILGLDSDYDEALLVRMIASVRKWVDEPKYNKKYGDDWIIARAENAYALVLGEINRQKQDPVVATLSVTIESDVESYVIPSTMGPAVGVYHLDSAWGLKWFYRRGSSDNELGKGVWVEGNLLRLQDTALALSSTLYVECWPNGCARLHCGTCTINADGDEVTFGATPYLGTLDRSVNAYAGSVLRIFNVTGTTVVGNLIQEMPISSYDAATRVATLARALGTIPTTDDGYIFYEICPQIPIGLDSVLGMRVAWEINAMEQPKKSAGCLAMYNANMRHLRLDAYCSQLQTAGQVDSDTYANESYGDRVYG